MSFRVGFDVGGTFTDFALQTDDGRLLTGNLGWADLGQAVHGTTLGSNIVIERKGADVALLTTRGFRDVLIIGREKRYQLYDRARLPVGAHLADPAVVEEAESTTVLPPGVTATIDRWANLLVGFHPA